MTYFSSCTAAWLSLLLPALTAAPAYHLAATIPVGGDGGWDYLTIDASAHRLYLAHDQNIVVINTQTNAVAGNIPGLLGAHGVALAPELDRAFVSSGRQNCAVVVRLSDLKVLKRVPTGQNPDAILYEPTHHQVYAFNGHSRSVTIFDARTGQIKATLPLGGKPEFAQADPDRNRIYVNLEDRSQVAALTPSSFTIAAQWPIAPGLEASGLAFDRIHGLLFAGCDNHCIIVLNVTTGQVAATIPAGEGIDACAFDPGTGLVYSSNGEDGTVTIAHEDAPNKFTVVQTLTTERGARTMQVDPSTHRIYLASALFGPAGAGQHSHPRNGTLKVLVYEPASPAP